MPAHSPRAKKPKRHLWFRVTPEILRKVEEMAARGLDHADIATSLGISTVTVYEHKKKNPDFANAIRRGMVETKSKLHNAMVRRALWDAKPNKDGTEKAPNPVCQQTTAYILTHRFKDLGEGGIDETAGETDSVFEDAERLRKAALDARARTKEA